MFYYFTKKGIISFLFVIFLLLTFEVFTKLPIPFLYEGLYYLFKFIEIFFFLYLLLHAVKYNQLNRLFFLVIPIMLIPFIGALKSQQIYEQPFWIGLIVERSKLDFIIPLMLLYLLERNLVSLKQIESILKNVSFLYLMFVLFIHLVINPEWLKNTSLVLVSNDKGLIVKLSNILIVFAFLYAYCKLVYERRLAYLIIVFLSLFTFVILSKARFLSISVVLCILIHLLFFTSFRKKLNILFLGTFFLIFAFLIVTFVLPEQSNKIANLFISAFNVFLGGEVIDNSSASRIMQSKIAYESIVSHPLFGTGLLSHTFNDGYLGLYRYFYPSDIGWLGVIYLYGLFGFIIFKLPLFIGLSYRFKGIYSRDVFLMTMRLFLLFFGIHGIVAAYEVNKIGMYLFVFAILYYYKYSIPSNNQNL